jgi:hypothetical protein
MNCLKVNWKNEKGDVVLTAIKQFNLINKGVLAPMDEKETVRILTRSKSTLEFFVSEGQSGSLSIFNPDGKTVYTGNLFNTKTIDIQQPGIYIIKMALNNKIITKKIVLN